MVPFAELEVLSSTTGRVARRIPVEARVITLGRAETNQVVLPDPLVSKTHAELSCQGSRLVLKDLGSRNGTYVNDQRVTVQPLGHGDVIRIGATRIRFKLALREEAAAPAVGSRSSGAQTIEYVGPPCRGDALDRAAHCLERLREATARIAAADDPVTLVEEVLADVFELSGAEAAELTMLESEREAKPLVRVSVDARQPRDQPIASARFGVGIVRDPLAPALPDARPLIEQVISERRAVGDNDLAPPAPGSPQALREAPARLGVPILGGGKLFGYVYVERAASRGSFSPAETAGIAILCDALGAYLRSAFED